MEGLSEHIVWDIPRTKYNQDIPWAGKKHGREEVREAFKLRDDVLEVHEFQPREIIVEGNNAAVIVYERSSIRGTKEMFELEMVQVMTVENEKISQWKAYYDPCAILAAFQETSQPL